MQIERYFEAVATLAPDLMIGVALTWVLLLYGLPPALYGWSLVARGDQVLGCLGIALGVLVSTCAVTLMLTPHFQFDALVFGGATIAGSIWLVAVAVLDRGQAS